MVFSWSDLSSPHKSLTYAFDTLEEFQGICTAKDYFVYAFHCKIFILWFDNFCYFVVSAIDKKPSTKYQLNIFSFWSQFEKKRGQGMSFLFKLKQLKTEKFGVWYWFLIAGWCNERNIMMIFLFAYLTYLIYAIYAWTYVMFEKIQNGFVLQIII